MAEITRVTLGGVPLSLREGDAHTWAISAGVTSVESTFVVTRERALDIMKRAQTQFASGGARQATRLRAQAAKTGPLELRVEAPGYKTLSVKGLYATSLAPEDENRLGVVVVDRRWLWRREHVLRDYNVRRLTGDKRLVGNELLPIQVRDNQPDFVYRRVTLKNGVPWTAKQVLTDLLTQLVGAGQFRIGNVSLFRDIVDLTIDDNGTSAMQRVLSYIPGASLYVDTDGVVVVFNSLDGGEAAALKTAGNPFPGSQVELIDKSLVRPKEVISLFELEPEIRFDYEEEATATTAVPGREARDLQNVVPVTDPTLTFNNKTVARNTWMPIDDWLTAVAGLSDFPGGDNGRGLSADENALGALTQRMIRRNWLSSFIHIRALFVAAHLGIPDPLWTERLDAIASYWRGAFRLLPQWRDKVKSIRAVRAAIVDQENGTRGKAEAIFDYIIRPSKRTLAKAASDNLDAAYNRSAYDTDFAAGGVGPVDVVVLEPESGTFQLIYKIDPWGDGVKIAPGTLLNAAPRQSAGGLAAAWNSVKMELNASWKMSVILTVALAAPNNQTRLHPVGVSLARAMRLLPGTPNATKALGPDWKIRVGPQIQTARAAWIDSRATEIEEAVFTDKPFPKDLLVNSVDLKAIAEANAARIQALFLDRHEGQQTVSLNPDVKPTGSLSRVTHIITLDSATTHMSLPPLQMPVDIYALMPDSTRKLLQRSVQE